MTPEREQEIRDLVAYAVSAKSERSGRTPVFDALIDLLAELDAVRAKLQTAERALEEITHVWTDLPAPDRRNAERMREIARDALAASPSSAVTGAAPASGERGRTGLIVGKHPKKPGSDTAALHD